MEKYVVSKHDSNYQVSDLGNIVSVRTGKLLKQENTNTYRYKTKKLVKYTKDG